MMDWSQRAWKKELAFAITDDQWSVINLLGFKVSNLIALRKHHYKL